MREKRRRSNIDKRERKTKTIFQQIEQHCKSMYTNKKQIQMKRNRKQNVLYDLCKEQQQQQLLKQKLFEKKSIKT